MVIIIFYEFVNIIGATTTRRDDHARGASDDHARGASDDHARGASDDHARDASDDACTRRGDHAARLSVWGYVESRPLNRDVRIAAIA